MRFVSLFLPFRDHYLCRVNGSLKEIVPQCNITQIILRSMFVSSWLVKRLFQLLLLVTAQAFDKKLSFDYFRMCFQALQVSFHSVRVQALSLCYLGNFSCNLSRNFVATQVARS